MPLQHISDDLLKSMRRGTTKLRTIDLVNTIRDKVPGIAIRTTLITGYPGETKAHHEELKEWVSETRFDRLGVFAYSHEENTHAYKLRDNVPSRTKQKRANEVMEIQRKISAELNKAKIGKTLKVLIDRKEGNYYIGRTEHDSPEVDNEVIIDSRPLLPEEGVGGGSILQTGKLTHHTPNTTENIHPPVTEQKENVRPLLTKEGKLRHQPEQGRSFYLRIGDFANIKITAAKEYDLVGEIERNI
jgi:tRNA A37 methylthiotransferase MiaB